MFANICTVLTQNTIDSRYDWAIKLICCNQRLYRQVANTTKKKVKKTHVSNLMDSGNTPNSLMCKLNGEFLYLLAYLCMSRRLSHSILNFFGDKIFISRLTRRFICAVNG